MTNLEGKGKIEIGSSNSYLHLPDELPLIECEDWQAVEVHADRLLHGFVSSSYINLINSRKYPLDAFSLGQLISKGWLLRAFAYLPTHKTVEVPALRTVRIPETVCVLGSWVGAIVQPFCQLTDFKWGPGRLKRVYGIDTDPAMVELSEQFNHRLVADNWKYKGVVADCDTLDSSSMDFVTSGELINVRPDVVINTSCEHMSTHWFDTCSRDQLIIMQTNNSPDFDGHINICESEQQMRDKYPLTDVLFSGTLKIPAYTRYMQIGFK